MTTAEPIPSSSASSWAWWPFVFGVVVGYVLFRPGGVIDYFLLPGGFHGEVASQPLMGRGTEGSLFNQGQERQNNQYQRRPESGGGVEGEDWFNEGDDEGPLPAPQRPGKSITLPPTDLFGQ
jgi:hypothetical protein